MNPPTILFFSVNRWRTQDSCVGVPGMSSGGSNQVRRPTAYVVSGSNYGSSGGKSFFVVCHPVHFSSSRAFILGLVLQFQAKSATAQSIYQERGGTCSCDAVAAAMIIWSPRGRGNILGENLPLFLSADAFPISCAMQHCSYSPSPFPEAATEVRYKEEDGSRRDGLPKLHPAVSRGAHSFSSFIFDSRESERLFHARCSPSFRAAAPLTSRPMGKEWAISNRRAKERSEREGGSGNLPLSLKKRGGRGDKWGWLLGSGRGGWRKTPSRHAPFEHGEKEEAANLGLYGPPPRGRPTTSP